MSKREMKSLYKDIFDSINDIRLFKTDELITIFDCKRRVYILLEHDHEEVVSLLIKEGIKVVDSGKSDV